MRDICRFWTLLVAVIFLAELAAAPDLDIFPVAKKGKVALVLTQPGCPPCARMKKELTGKTFAGFTLEWGSMKDKKYAAKAAPTTIKLVAGKEVDRRVGHMTGADLEGFMAK